MASIALRHTFLGLESVEQRALSRTYKVTSGPVLGSHICDNTVLAVDDPVFHELTFDVADANFGGITRISSYIPSTANTMRGLMTYEYLDVIPTNKTNDLVNSTIEINEPTHLHSSLKLKITSDSKLVEGETSLRSSILESDIGGSGGGSGPDLGALRFTIEVFRLCEYDFEFPKNFLNGMASSDVATVNGDHLIVYTKEIGEVSMYSTRGQVTIRTLPGMKQRVNSWA